MSSNHQEDGLDIINLEETEEDIYYEATDLTVTPPDSGRDCHIAPSLETIGSIPVECGSSRNDDKAFKVSRVREGKGSPAKRKKTTHLAPHLPRGSTASRISAGVQATPDEALQDGERRNAFSSTPRGREQAGIETNSFLSDDVFVDAREFLIDVDETVVDQGELKELKERYKGSGMKNSNRGGNQNTLIPCPNQNTFCVQKNDFQNGGGLASDSDLLPSLAVDKTQSGSQSDESCCGCVLVVLYWVGVLLLVLFFLSLFFVIFLLFSRNHSLGVGPGFIYSDVDLIRKLIDPYLDLRHRSPPPT